jgi:hypothetical protein
VELSWHGWALRGVRGFRGTATSGLFGGHPEKTKRSSREGTSDVDLPVDAEFVGERAEDVAPERRFEWGVLHAADAEVV